MYPDSRLGSEVDAVCAVGDVMVCEEYSSAELNIRNHAVKPRPVVFEVERSEACAIRVLPLGYEVHGYEINGVFEIRFPCGEQNKSKTESRLKASTIAPATGNTVSARNKYLA